MKGVLVDGIEAVQEAVKTHTRLLPRGAATKPALAAPPDDATHPLDLSRLAGVLEYEPTEFTFTALAGTPLVDIATLLAENGQYLPFDPPLVKTGATLGGTVAAGLSGPGRHRYGGIRDFILGVRFVDGAGRLAKGGGKVVKNAAGFDLPKLLVGSMGRLGVIVEATFKVFPAPQTFETLKVTFGDLSDALSALVKLSRAALEVDALDLAPPGTLYVRIGGLAETLPPRIERLEEFFGRGGETLQGAAEADFWEALRELELAPSGLIAKIPVTPKRIPALDMRLEQHGAARHYSSAGTLAWVAWPDGSEQLHRLLSEMDCAGLSLLGSGASPRLGKVAVGGLLARIKKTLDPDLKFPEF